MSPRILYLPSNAQTFLAAIASALLGDYPAEIVYLDDATGVSPHVEAGIRKRFRQIAFSARSDRAAIEEFATLPKSFPAVVRRNISVTPGARIHFPADRPPFWLGRQYRTAYIYLSGNFVSKTLRRRCKTIVLREEGLINYHTLSFGPGHALLRLMFGRSPRRHIMGEERWIDRIEVNQPEALPVALQAKARKLEFSSLLDGLPKDVAAELTRIFWGERDPPPVGNTANICRSRSETNGFCTTAEKTSILIPPLDDA